ncbi:MAG: VOC family protein [Acidobacteriota bacterium]|nr:VOC family protein [Acidobacteriota bacterium]
MMQLKIDHVVVAGSALTPMKEAFASVGLKTEFGGIHSNEITHMAYLPFDDGSYLELLSTRQPRALSPLWHRHILNDAGLCAWAIEVPNVADEVQRVAELGVPVDGPFHMSRKWPDGAMAEWDMATIGEGEPGTLLPFLIKDRTPRELRIPPYRPGGAERGARPRADRLMGIHTVVLGVRHLEKAIALYRRVYGFAEPEIVDNPLFGARLARFADTPVVLATPMRGRPDPRAARYEDEEDQDWLETRLHRFGDGPAACLLRIYDLEMVIERFEMNQDPEPWFDQQIAWFDDLKVGGVRLGVIG